MRKRWRRARSRPGPLALGLITISILLLGGMILPLSGRGAPAAEPPFADVLWQQRGLDVIAQIVLVFASVMGILGLLAEASPPQEKRAVDERPAEPAQSYHGHCVPESAIEQKKARV